MVLTALITRRRVTIIIGPLVVSCNGRKNERRKGQNREKLIARIVNHNVIHMWTTGTSMHNLFSFVCVGNNIMFLVVLY